jgi:SSS family solute:Na+ symporter
VVQGVLKTLGALLILFLIIWEIPGGVTAIYAIAKSEHKFSLGTAAFNFKESSFWVVLFYGFFINLNNFGMDQNYVQRYHTAISDKQARKSVWLSVFIYVPASLLFFIIGTSLFAYYQMNPAIADSLKHGLAVQKLGANASAMDITNYMSQLKPADYADKVMPHFMVNKVPTVFLGLLVAAILSAAMSTISSGMNASATVFTKDIYKRYFSPQLSDKKEFVILYSSTIIVGAIGLIVGLSMIGIKSILDVWWELSGIFAGGMLGLFLLGLISKQTKNTEALIAVIIGVIVIVWFSFSDKLGPDLSYLKIALHKNMIIVVGTLTIFLTGILFTKIKQFFNKKNQ